MITSTNDVVSYQDAVDILIEAMGDAIGIDLRHEMPPLHEELITKHIAKLKAVCYEVEEEVR